MNVSPESRERGERIKAAREHARISQEALADALTERMGYRVRQTHVSRWERGANKPSDRYAIAVAAILEVAAGWLMMGPASGAPAPEWWEGGKEPLAAKGEKSQPTYGRKGPIQKAEPPSSTARRKGKTG